MCQVLQKQLLLLEEKCSAEDSEGNTSSELEMEMEMNSGNVCILFNMNPQISRWLGAKWEKGSERMIMSLKKELARSQDQSHGWGGHAPPEFLPRSCHLTSGELLNLSGSPFRDLIHKGVETSHLYQNLNNDVGYVGK